MKTFGIAVLCGVLGYLIGAVGGFGLVNQLSSNQHDRYQEAAMTGAFFTGPVVGILGFLGALIVRVLRRKE